MDRTKTDGMTVTHVVHVVPTAQADSHVLSPLCACGPEVDHFTDDDDPIADVSTVTYHRDLP